MKSHFLFFLTICFSLFSLDASASVLLKARNGVHFELDGAGTHKGSITLLNSGTKPSDFQVVLVDYTYNHKGDSFFQELGTNPLSLGENLSIAPREGTLAPGESIDLSFTYTGIDGLEGTYWSCVLIRHGDGWKVTSPNEDEKKRVTIQQRMQYAVPISCTYPTENKANIKVIGRNLVNHAQRGHLLSIDIQNTGAIAIDPIGKYEIFTADGESVSKGELPQQKLYPTTSVNFAIPLKDLKAGRYFVVTYFEDGDESFALQYNFEFNPES